ncbi:hypothetical protein [Lutibacter sp.]
MKKYLIPLFWLSGLFFVYAQQESVNEKEVDNILDELFKEDEFIDELINSISKFEFLYMTVNYNSNTYFSGRDIGINQYNITPQITYVNSNGLFASISGIYYSEFIPGWDVTTATLGYSKSFGKKKLFRYHTSYSKYFYANEANDIYGNTINLGLGVRNKDRTLGTQIVGTYLFGTEQSYQIASRSYVALNLYKDKKSTLRLRPQLNITAGKQTIELARVTVVSGELFTEYTQNDVFDLINTQLSIPLQYNINSFDFELGYNINFPNPIGDETSLDTTGYFNFSISYLLSL